MPRHIHLEPHLTNDDLEARYRRSRDPVERSHWHFLWLLACGLTATAVARVTGLSAYWIGQMARRYNRDGPDGMRDRRHTAKAHPRVLLAEGEHADLCTELAKPHPAGDRWCGRTVAAWIGERLGCRVCRQTGWSYLRRVGARWRKPRPRHLRTDRAAQAEFVTRLRPSPRGTWQPRFHAHTSSCGPWTNIALGGRPTIRKAWTLGESWPVAPVEHRFAWRYLVDFVHPASGRTVFHLASSVSIPLFDVELAAFARAVGAGPHQTDRIGPIPSQVGIAACGYASPTMCTCSSCRRIRPNCNRLSIGWPPTNTVLVNQHFASIDEWEEIQAQRCVTLQARRELIRSTTLFHWWPQVSRHDKVRGKRSMGRWMDRTWLSRPLVLRSFARCSLQARSQTR